MEYQEYPKALYLNGNLIAVADADAETAARAEGYLDHAEDLARADEQELLGDAPAPAAKGRKGK